MIESEEKKKRLTDMVERWCKFTKVKPCLRDYDIPNLVSQIIGEFYHIQLCCGHYVSDFDEGVSLEIDEPEGKAYGSYCKDCAKKMLKEKWAREYKELKCT